MCGPDMISEFHLILLLIGSYVHWLFSVNSYMYTGYKDNCTFLRR